jgi:hypothetical protein
VSDRNRFPAAASYGCRQHHHPAGREVRLVLRWWAPLSPLTHRLARAVVTYLALVHIIAVLPEAFPPFPVLTWLGKGLQR